MLLLNVLYKMKGFEQGGSVSGRKQSGGLFLPTWASRLRRDRCVAPENPFQRANQKGSCDLWVATSFLVLLL